MQEKLDKVYNSIGSCILD